MPSKIWSGRQEPLTESWDAADRCQLLLDPPHVAVLLQRNFSHDVASRDLGGQGRRREGGGRTRALRKKLFRGDSLEFRDFDMCPISTWFKGSV